MTNFLFVWKCLYFSFILKDIFTIHRIWDWQLFSFSSIFKIHLINLCAPMASVEKEVVHVVTLFFISWISIWFFFIDYCFLLILLFLKCIKDFISNTSEPVSLFGAPLYLFEFSVVFFVFVSSCLFVYLFIFKCQILHIKNCRIIWRSRVLVSILSGRRCLLLASCWGHQKHSITLILGIEKKFRLLPRFSPLGFNAEHGWSIYQGFLLPVSHQAAVLSP